MTTHMVPMDNVKYHLYYYYRNPSFLRNWFIGFGDNAMKDVHGGHTTCALESKPRSISIGSNLARVWQYNLFLLQFPEKDLKA